MDTLKTKHKNLAEELKSVCNCHGIEINPKRSAKVIYELALNMRNIGNCLGKSDKKNLAKLAWIRSAVLFNAAIVRKPDNIGDIKRQLQDLCLDILLKANAVNLKADLVEQAKLIFDTKIKAMRQMVCDKLDQSCENRNMAWAKEIETLQCKVSDAYADCMKEIMEYCVCVVGDPPCGYALAGMGSLARKEITPYSDFESIIILEDGVQNNEKILEYFKWVATIFQLILVNFGETIIRFVNIHELNDAYDKAKDWFYDAYTPCGISPDGFAPHACKNPLGRLEGTEEKPWATELIKTVRGMLKYLESKEDLKNGYHLADVLTKTCFVCGDKQLVDEFQKEVMQLNLHDQFVSIIVDDLKNLKLANVCLPKVTNSYNFKKLAYRTVSQHMLAIGQLCQLESLNSFDIARELLSSPRVQISEDDYDKMIVTAATAYEIRLKLYMTSGGQEDIVVTQNDNNVFVPRSSTKELLTNSVGTENIIDFFKNINCLRRSVDSLLDSTHKSNININLQCDDSDDCVVELFGMQEHSIKLYEKHLSQAKDANVKGWYHENLALQYFKAGNIPKAHEHAKARALLYKSVNVERFMPHLVYSLFLEKSDEFLDDLKSLEPDETESNKILQFCSLFTKGIDSIFRQFGQFSRMQAYKNHMEKICSEMHARLNTPQTSKSALTVQVPDKCIDICDPGTSGPEKMCSVFEAVMECAVFAHNNTPHSKQKEIGKGLALTERLFKWFNKEISNGNELDEIDQINADALLAFEMKSVAENILNSKIFQIVLEKMLGFGLDKGKILTSLQGFSLCYYIQSNYKMAAKLSKMLAVFAGWMNDPFQDPAEENKVILSSLHMIADCLKQLNDQDGVKRYRQREETLKNQLS